MPAPVPKCSSDRRRSGRGRAVKKVRMPTASRARRRRRRRSRWRRSRARGGPAPARRSPASARIFGAPVTEPGGKVAARISAQPTPSASRALHGGDQVRQPGMLLPGQQFGDRHRSRPADPAQVVADQVGDHDVLRDSPCPRTVLPVAVVPLIGEEASTSPSRDRNSSGEARDDPADRPGGARPGTAPGCRRPAAAPAPADPTVRRSGADSIRQRLTW